MRLVNDTTLTSELLYPGIQSVFGQKKVRLDRPRNVNWEQLCRAVYSARSEGCAQDAQHVLFWQSRCDRIGEVAAPYQNDAMSFGVNHS